MDKLMLQLGEEFLFLCPYHIDNLVRLGCNSDGGYVIPQCMVDSATALLSLGVGTDWSFEQDFARRKPSMPIHMYDIGPEPGRLVMYKQRQFDSFVQDPVMHIKKYIGNSEDRVAFNNAVNALNAKHIFVKMDIEGDEYQCIESIVSNQHRIIGLAMEFHSCWADGPTFKNAIHQLQQSFDIVHVHGCNNDCVSPSNQPNVMEITFVRKDFLLTRVPRPFFYLEDLDHPVNSKLPEHVMFLPDHFGQTD